MTLTWHPLKCDGDSCHGIRKAIAVATVGAQMPDPIDCREHRTYGAEDLMQPFMHKYHCIDSKEDLESACGAGPYFSLPLYNVRPLEIPLVIPVEPSIRWVRPDKACENAIAALDNDSKAGGWQLRVKSS